MHILHISKEEVSHTKEGGQPSRRVKVTPEMSNGHSMCIHRVSSVPTELVAADFFVYASVPFAKHCLKDNVAYTKGRNNGGQNQKWLQSRVQNQKWPTSGQGGYITLPSRGSPPLQSGGQNQKWAGRGQGGYIAPAT